jgi:hypothetical protein
MGFINPTLENRVNKEANNPRQVVVLPSFMRVAATNILLVSLFVGRFRSLSDSLAGFPGA